jgi:transcriptional regulator with XRE-family HTH domain
MVWICQHQMDIIFSMNAEQCRMARAALRISVRELAEIARVGTNTVVRMEAGEKLQERTVEAIQAALEKAGVEFIAENGGGSGVRLKKAKRKAK